MTTQTREQVIEQAIQGHAGTRDAMRWLYEHALTAGRDQGLREAKEVCEAKAESVIEANTSRGKTNHAAAFAAGVLENCAAAIEQLRAAAEIGRGM